jgi:hypothetical protein
MAFDERVSFSAFWDFSVGFCRAVCLYSIIRRVLGCLW